MTLAMLDRPGPGYIRVGCGREPVLCDESVEFDLEKLRVVCDNMGGGFGMKGGCYPEYALAL